MAIGNVVAVWLNIAPQQLIVKGLIVVFLFQAIRFLYSGLVIRLKFRQLKAQGHV